jgi:hypothetical protein
MRRRVLGEHDASAEVPVDVDDDAAATRAVAATSFTAYAQRRLPGDMLADDDGGEPSGRRLADGARPSPARAPAAPGHGAPVVAASLRQRAADVVSRVVAPFSRMKSGITAAPGSAATTEGAPAGANLLPPDGRTALEGAPNPAEVLLSGALLVLAALLLILSGGQSSGAAIIARLLARAAHAFVRAAPSAGLAWAARFLLPAAAVTAPRALLAAALVRRVARGVAPALVVLTAAAPLGVAPRAALLLVSAFVCAELLAEAEEDENTRTLRAARVSAATRRASAVRAQVPARALLELFHKAQVVALSIDSESITELLT